MRHARRVVTLSELPGWEREDPRQILAAWQRSAHHIRAIKPYRTGSFGLEPDLIASQYDAAQPAADLSPDGARQHFEREFLAIDLTPPDRGHVTAFYEPEVACTKVRDEDHTWPFYRRPDDLVDIDDDNRPDGFDPYFAYGLKKTASGSIRTYPERRTIDEGLLAGRGLEIAWASSRVDVFFAHVQGAARLRFPDGRLTRITYAAKTGHRFSGIGRHLIELGEIAERDVSMASIRAWLKAHPERESEILWHNPSYIFFREAPVDDEALGPVAAAKVPLQPMRSIAVEREIHTFGSLFYIAADGLDRLTDAPFARLMVAQDTGSAIVGMARADIFTGSGEAAGDLAGNVNNRADFYLLVPRDLAARYA